MNCKNLPFRSAGALPLALSSMNQFVSFVQDLIEALEPKSGIDYWSDLLPAASGTLAKIRERKAFVHHVFAYAASGSNEGMRIEAGVVLRGGDMVPLAGAKSFGCDDECWRIARHLSGALELLFWYEQQPYIVDMLRALKVAYPRPLYAGSLPQEGFLIETTERSIAVRHRDGLELDLWQFDTADLGWFIRAYASDWLRLLRAAGGSATVTGPYADVVSQPPETLAYYALNACDRAQRKQSQVAVREA